MVAPLKLKREKVGAPTISPVNPKLSILVDTGVYHLEQPFDYLLPEKFEVNPGDWVSVPFKGSNRIGLVISREAFRGGSKLSFINRPAIGPKIDEKFLRFYRSVSDRWAVPIFDVLRFVQKFRDTDQIDTPVQSKEGKRIYHQLSAESDEIEQVRAFCNNLIRNGSTLVIVPEKRIFDLLQGERFEVGMRGSSLKPNLYKNLVILREESEHHFEIKSPGFNSRDVALLRNDLLQENVYFLGFTPSLEMTALIEKGYVNLKRVSSKVILKTRPSIQGELIPSSLITEFKNYLQLGTVLVLAPTKGYGLAISCANCRNIAKCSCGGRLTKQSRSDSPHCTICRTRFSDWRCQFCGEKKIYLLGKGIERIAEEFGKSFPNTAIHIATADKFLEPIGGKRNIVLATIGTAPIQRYSAVMFLDGLNLASDLRSSERALSYLFKYTSLSGGRALIVDRPENPAVNALYKWNPFALISRELDELKATGLPPFARHVLIKCPTEESARLYSGLLHAIREGRIDSKVKIFNLQDGTISIFFASKVAIQTLEFLRELQRRRSMSGKRVLNMRVDPYLLG